MYLINQMIYEIFGIPVLHKTSNYFIDITPPLSFRTTKANY